MAATLYRQLVIGQGTLTKPGLCLADYTQAGTASIHRGASATGISGSPTAIRFSLGALPPGSQEKLTIDSSGVTVSALGIVSPYGLSTESRVLTVSTKAGQAGQVGQMGTPSLDGLALCGDRSGLLYWATATPGAHIHRLSDATKSLYLDANMVPETTNAHAIGTASALWSGLHVTGLRIESGSIYLAPAPATVASATLADVVVRTRIDAPTNGLLKTITSPTSGDKVLRWNSTSGIIWGDDATGGGGGIPEVSASPAGATWGRQFGTWVQLALPKWGVSQINFDGHVIPTASNFNLGSDAFRWGLHASTISAKSLANFAPPTTQLGVLADASTGNFGTATAAHFKTWLGLGSTVTGSGSQYGLAYWSTPTPSSTLASAPASFISNTFEFSAPIKVLNPNSISVIGSGGLYLNGFRVPSMDQALGDYVLSSTGSANAETRLSWKTAPSGTMTGLSLSVQYGIVTPTSVSGAGGAMAVTWQGQTSHKVLVGPGGAGSSTAAPTFRVLDGYDLATNVSNGYVLGTNGSGAMSWVQQPSSGIPEPPSTPGWYVRSVASGPVYSWASAFPTGADLPAKVWRNNYGWVDITAGTNVTIAAGAGNSIVVSATGGGSSSIGEPNTNTVGSIWVLVLSALGPPKAWVWKQLVGQNTWQT